MNADFRSQNKTPTSQWLAPVPGGLLQRKCACGNQTLGGGECAECQKKRQGLQRKEMGSGASLEVPSIVHDVLDSPGKPLDTSARAMFEPRFGQDFSQVRVHTDAKAAESARQVDALAYTVGKNVVFGNGQYVPGTSSGTRLLAHELAHVVQQDHAETPTAGLRIGPASDRHEHAADRVADQVTEGGIAPGIEPNAVELAAEVGRNKPAPAGVSGKMTGQVPETVVARPYSGLQPTLNSTALGIEPAAPALQREPAPDRLRTEPDPASREASAGVSITLDNFAFGKSDLTEGHKKQLAKEAAGIISLLTHYPDSFGSVVGFTDAVGTEKDNKVLGQQRADAVLAELLANGVPKDLLKANSLGETLLSVDTQQPEGKNRRVEIFFTARRFFGSRSTPIQPGIPSLSPTPNLQPISPSPKLQPNLPLPSPKAPGTDEEKEKTIEFKKVVEVELQQEKKPGETAETKSSVKVQLELTIQAESLKNYKGQKFEVSFGQMEASFALGLEGEKPLGGDGKKVSIKGTSPIGVSFTTIPSPISMGDLGFGRHPARLAVAWHPADSTMAKA